MLSQAAPASLPSASTIGFEEDQPRLSCWTSDTACVRMAGPSMFLRSTTIHVMSPG